MRLKTILISCFILSISSASFAKGLNLKFTVKGLSNDTMILAYYFGDKQYVKDTIKGDKNGVFTLKRDTDYPGGIYLGVFKKLGNRYFEFILNEPKFEMETDSSDLSMHMKIIGSLENKLFYDDMKFLNEKRKESEPLNRDFRTAKDEAEKKTIRAKMVKIDDEVKASRNNIIATNPKAFYANIIRAMKEDDVPEPPRDATGKMIDSSYGWRFYKAHFWTNFDFNDDRLIRTPIFHNKLKQYYTQTVVQIPDSLIVATDELLNKPSKKSDLFKYMLVYMLNEMAASKIMGFDAVYTHIVNEYYAKGYATWIDSVQSYKIKERGRILAPLLIGKTAKNLTLADTTLKTFHSLYDTKAKYTVLIFWDPDCGHCKKEVPVLGEAYQRLKPKGVEVYGVAIMPIEEIKKWTAFINEHKLNWINVADPYHQTTMRQDYDIEFTPQIFILDEKKTIIAKRIGADQVEDFILHELDHSYKPTKLLKIDDSQGHEEIHDK